jgi:N-methylhydantoinase A
MTLSSTPEVGYRIGVDVGGTFTDLVAFHPQTAAFHTLKTPSTPHAPHRAVIDGLGRLREDYGVQPADIGELLHGTTIGVNTVLQRNGARVGLLINEGFRDILQLGRVRLPDVYSYLVERPAPITPRRFVKEIAVRRLVDGTVDKKLDEQQVRASARQLASMGAEAITVCFIHSYKYPGDELRAVEIIREELPDVYACASSEVWPEMREYERAMVGLINSHIGPRMQEYYASLISDLATLDVHCPVYSTKSNGGVMTAQTASARPVETLLSGPASGVVAARYVAALAGFENVVAVDMGGTSTEAAVIQGDVRTSTSSEVGDFQVVLPAVDVRSLGAGGGSIAWLDRAGVLKVGPKSAGSDPGPACYGLGGTEPAVTDAYLALGVLDPERFLGGRMPLRDDLARGALQTIASRLGLGVEETAESILRVATSNMYAKLVPLLAQAGLDPSDTAIVAYGGAGPTHAFLLAREVGITTVVVPRHPGTLCALGSLVADVKSDFIRTVNLALKRDRLQAATAIIRAELDDLAAEARTWLANERPDQGSYALVFSADVRYSGQAFTVDTPLGDALTAGDDLAADMIQRFEVEYMRQYNVDNSASQVEVVNLRLTVVGDTPKPQLPQTSPRTSGVLEPAGARTVHINGTAAVCAVYDREQLASEDTFAGPAIVDQYDTTTFIPAGFTVTVDPYLNLIGRAAK